MTEVDLPSAPTPDLDRLRRVATLQEHRFRSAIPLVGPLIARLRAAWNSVSTKWYVRPLLQQQNEFNELVANEITTQAARLNMLTGEVARLSALAGEVVQSRNLDVRIHDHDAWLIAEDHEQADLVRDLAELRLLVIQMNGLLLDLNTHAQRTDATNSGQAKDHMA
jgi:hypothetical protein